MKTEPKNKLKTASSGRNNGEHLSQQCHGAEKQKGDYRLDTLETAMRGGESGETAIVPGEPTKSHLVRLMMLPEDHEDVMPPKGKERPSDEELLTVMRWISEGAPGIGTERREAPKIAPAPTIIAQASSATIAQASPTAKPAPHPKGSEALEAAKALENRLDDLSRRVGELALGFQSIRAALDVGARDVDRVAAESMDKLSDGCEPPRGPESVAKLLSPMIARIRRRKSIMSARSNRSWSVVARSATDRIKAKAVSASTISL